MKSNKKILHLDGDAFFAAVEIAKNPRLRGLPVVVGQDRSIATALSYEAKARGISRGMPVWQIKHLCPEAVILPTDFTSYSIFSKRMIAIVRRYVTIVEEYSVDECFADLSSLEDSECLKIMDKIAHDIEAELDITVSLGLAPNKVLAKIASKWQKPKGKTVIGERVDQFLGNLSVGKVWGIGSSTLNLLTRLGVKTALDFVNLPESVVEENMYQHHKVIWQELKGHSIMQVNPLAHEELPKSISRTATFHPFTRDRNRLLTEISRHVEEACFRARELGLFASHCSFFIKSRDFRIRRTEVDFPVATNIPSEIMSGIRRNFHKLFGDIVLSLPIDHLTWRASGVTLYGLRTAQDAQRDLFGKSEADVRQQAVFSSVDKMNNKFGAGAVMLASSLGKGKFSHISEILGAKQNEWGVVRVHGGRPRKLSLPYLGEI